MNPGRPPFMQTGRGIPSAFMQKNIGTGEDLQAQVDALAKAKLQKNIESKPLVGSNDTRTETATLTTVQKGKKVEKFAKTPAEIAAWKAAPKENKEKYIDKTLTATGTASDTGKDKPVTPTATTPKKSFGMFYKQTTSMPFGGGTTSGYADPNTTEGENILKGGFAKDKFDKTDYPGDMNHSRSLKHSSQNNFEAYNISEEEDRVKNFMGNNIISPYDSQWKDKKGENPGTGEARRQNWVKGRIDYINQKDTEAKSRLELKNQKIAEAKKKAEEFKNSKAKKPAPVAMQLKKKAKAPIKMKKC